ncbi:MarR family winged helix-turn-helix transcriptional regulator [Aeromicrobium sp. UC242_57]|uniref:MarR family winged helix-turn-helix transcriptional regulator n=1 Tax=Aeromicrobium sp. UC242_57 TaxID=3374624 RepID=UPI00378A8051
MQSDARTAEDAILQLSLAVGRRLRARLDGDPVEWSQATLLFTLKRRGALRLGDLAESMRLDASTVSRHVQQLADRELISREPDPVDGRACILAITDAGRAALTTTFDHRRSILTEALADWDDTERERLRDDLVRLNGSLGALP